MADLNDLQAGQTVKIVGQDSTGLETNAVQAEDGAADSKPTSLVGLITKSWKMLFNGTTWDRARSASVGTNVPATGIQANVPYGQYNSTLPQITDGNFGLAQISRWGGIYETLHDPESNRFNRIGLFNEHKIGEWTKLLGGNPIGTSINTVIWTPAASGTGAAVTSGSGLFTLTSGTGSNASTTLTSTDIAPYISGTTNVFLAGIRIPDAGVTNNERRWGAWSATNGVYFKFAGSTLSVCRLQNGVETAVASTSFTGGNAFTLDTNFHTYEIWWTSSSAHFYVDRKLLHILTNQTGALADVLHFPVRYENKSVNGGTTSAQLLVRGSGIHRFGRGTGRPRSTFISTASTTILKTEPGTLHRIVVTRDGSLGNNTLTIYDSTTGSGTIMFQLTLGSATVSILEFDVDFNNGLTIVSSSGNYSFTVVWE